MHEQVKRFQHWAETYFLAERTGEWEEEYEGWNEYTAAVLSFLSGSPYETWTAEEISDLLFSIARNNESEHFSHIVAEVPSRLFALSRQAIRSHERDARWQLAARLGEVKERKEEAESLLLELMNDEEEYVRRRALMALALLGSKKTEFFAERAWKTGEEYQRIAALWALKDISSPKLKKYIQMAFQDGREHVVRNAGQIQGLTIQSGASK